MFIKDGHCPTCP